MHHFVAPGQKILLKPNLVGSRPPDKCVTTHPLVVKAVGRLVIEAGATPLIGESPQLGPVKKIVSKCGIEGIAGDLGIDIVEFEPVRVPYPQGKIFKKFVIGKIIKEVDGVINLPKLKTHALLGLTLSVKNIFGCIPGARKAQWHVKTYEAGIEYLAQVLLDLFYCVHPVLNIVDGVTAMQGMGPGSGVPRHVGLLVAGADGVAVDRVVAEALSVQAEMIPTLAVALREGYGFGKLADIGVVGEQLDAVRVSDFELAFGDELSSKILKIFKKFFRAYLTTQPRINQAACEACAMCSKACPLHCIASENDAFKIDETTCIQCLCCFEICPHRAIDLRRGALLNVAQGWSKTVAHNRPSGR
jgi:uncharacterized protein (DUF362 family)/NAD-dependent dihydropyrimidine dehydrogenase PreA subunit